MVTQTTTITKLQSSQLSPPPWPMTALILCGGKSTRMGRPKAFLPYHGNLMISHMIDLVSQLFAEVLLVTNEPELFEDLEIDTVKDILPHRGPLGGILSGLLIAGHEQSFVVACDMPFIDIDLISEMVKKRHTGDMLVLMHEKGIEPLIGIYSKSCIRTLEESLFAGQTSLNDIAAGLNAKVFFYSQNSSQSNKNTLPPYFDIDTPQDYAAAIMHNPK